jgi:cyclomaltodextrinase
VFNTPEIFYFTPNLFFSFLIHQISFILSFFKDNKGFGVRFIEINFLMFLLLLAGATECSSDHPRADFSVPQWAKEAVWYQIFPERFRNGDRDNDPTINDVSQTWPYLHPAGWHIHPWTSDWYKLQPWEEATGRDFYTNAGARRYGGDLQGVLDQLDYLEDLGITAIYFNPLFESPSHHKYDASMYRHIDNNFGPDPAGDSLLWCLEDPVNPDTWRWTSADSLFLQLIRTCHARGIRVIIDGVFNHVGNFFWAFRDVVKHQQQSPFKDWFIIKRWDDPSTPQNEFEYQGWNGVRELPEIRETEDGLVPGFQQHLQRIVHRWMDPDGDGDPSDGIDGWRLDVAEKINMNFWRTFHRWVKGINPDAYLVGEIWWEDWPRNKMFNAAPWMQGDVFDAVMNYRFTRAINQFAIDEKNKIDAAAFADSIMRISSDYPKETVYALQNLVDSHDMERIASQIVNPDRWIDHGGNPAQNLLFNVRKPDAEERLKQKLIVGLQMTLPGSPMIYYGDETGMWGGDDPDCRKPMIWPDLKYDAEKTHPFGQPRETDTVEFDRELFDWTRKLIHIRRGNPVLMTGELQFFNNGLDAATLGFKRSLKTEQVVVLANSEGKRKHLQPELNSFTANEIRDLITGQFWKTKVIGQDLILEPYQIVILQEL